MTNVINGITAVRPFVDTKHIEVIANAYVRCVFIDENAKMSFFAFRFNPFTGGGETFRVAFGRAAALIFFIPSLHKT